MQLNFVNLSDNDPVTSASGHNPIVAKYSSAGASDVLPYPHVALRHDYTLSCTN